jgi:hypothetical protein
MPAMRLATVVLLGALLPLAARADVIDLSGGESRRSRRVPTFAVRGEAGSDFAPYGTVGAALSYFTPNPLGGFEIEGGAGATFPGVQLGLALRQLLGESGDYFAFEISVAGNTVKKLGGDPTVNRVATTRTWSSIGVGFEHRQGFLTFGVIAALSFLTSFDFVPHGMVHGGIGLAF